EQKNEQKRASEEDRSALCQTQPFIFQRTITGSRRSTPCNEHNPNVISQIELVCPHNFPQSAPNTIANNCAAQTPADHKTGARYAPVGLVVVVASAGVVAGVVSAGVVVAVGLAASGAVVSVFCSHAARSAALARMQMYFFIVEEGILL